MIWVLAISLVSGLSDGPQPREQGNLHSSRKKVWKQLESRQSSKRLINYLWEEEGRSVGLGSLRWEFHRTFRQLLSPSVLLPGSPVCQNGACILSRKTQRQPSHTQIIWNKYYKRDGETWHLGLAWAGERSRGVCVSEANTSWEARFRPRAWPQVQSQTGRARMCSVL